jgi:hypothetical protein
MRLSGFTVIRNAILMGYPVLESIRSILPLVDEFVVGVGQSDDGTRELILGLSDPKLRVFDAFWDPTRTVEGRVLSEKTNEALDRCRNDWCFYLQADEVVHEADLPIIERALTRHDDDPRVQGLLFEYVHFYGSYDTVATSRKWYRNEVRVVRRSSGIRSHGDAQGFRVGGEKPVVAPSVARIFHYGWVKPPALMGRKNRLLSRWWHGTARDRQYEDFRFERLYGLRRFEGSHPAVMRELVAAQTWEFDFRRRPGDWRWKDLKLVASDLFEKLFRRQAPGYRGYRRLRD